jgi:hypothetical protein
MNQLQVNHSDMSQTAKDLDKLNKLKKDFLYYSKYCLWIRDKPGAIRPFHLNRAQLYVHQKIEMQRGQTGKVRALVLKGRQQGISTYIGGRFFHQVTHRRGCQAFILTHALDATSNLFKMARRYYEHCPQFVKPNITMSNVKELVFGGLDSGYKVGTAENKSVGRSATIQLFHGSECAFWNNASDHASGIMQAIPEATGTEIILESTANGVGNYFHQMWQNAEAGLSDYQAIFVPWFWQDEYMSEVSEDFHPSSEEIDLKDQYGLTDEQLQWRRMKILNLSITGVDGLKVFKQEYPMNAAEAFQMTGEDAFIEPELVMRARKTKDVEKYGPLIIGCDPARFGDDRTSIIRRRGRVAYNLESYSKKDNMEVVGILYKIIKNENPAKIIIDIGGGSGIIDRLNEMGFEKIICSANFGINALDDVLYANKRAEMWALMKLWLQEQPCQIPDLDSLQADICNTKYKFRSNSQLLMQSKDEMKKAGIRSPDEADALALTFYLPMEAIIEKPDTAVISIAISYKQRQDALKASRGAR